MNTLDIPTHVCDGIEPCGYAVMQWDAMTNKYVELVKRPHKHLCYEYIKNSNLRNAKVVAFYW